MATGLPTRRNRRIDENAPPQPTRTRSGLTTTTASTLTNKSTTDATSKSSIPVMKRQSSNAAIRSRAALGEVTNAGKLKTGAVEKGRDKPAKKEEKAEKVERKPLLNTASGVQVAGTRRTRSSIVDTKREVQEAQTVAKRKLAAHPAVSARPTVARSRSTTASTSALSQETKPLQEKTLNVKAEEPARKRRKTSTPPIVEDDDLADEAKYDEDGKEILLSSGGKAVGLRSPKRSRPKDEGWEDLDAEDEGDPTMVSEYVVDAFNYMMVLEKITMPDPNYMDSQAELQWKMRSILMDWLIEVHQKFRLLPETLFIAVNLIDRFLTARVISLIKFQLVGLTALFVAAKYEEVICPSITHFAHMADGGYGVEEILKAERYMLQTISFDMSYPNPLHFLRRISKADGYDIQARTIGKFLIEISCVEHRLLRFSPSLLAAAGMWLARLCLERGSWNVNLVHYSTYSVEQLLEPAQIMLNYLLNPDLDLNSSFYKKYAAKKHMKASVFMHQWAVSRWPDSDEDGDASGEKGFELYIETGYTPVEPRSEA